MSEIDMTHLYEPRQSPIPSPYATGKVTFRVGDEVEHGTKENDEFTRSLFYNDLPRPSLTSFSIPSAADLSRPYLSAHFEKRQSVYFDSRSTHEAIPVLVELFDLQVPDTGGAEWEETGRWIKYEEDVEGVDHHWGRPHVAFLTFHSLIQLRHCFSKGLMLLDIDASTYDEICQKIAESMKKRFHINDEATNAVLKALGQNHKHVPEHHLFFKSFTHSGLVESQSPTSKRKENGLASIDKLSSSAIAPEHEQKRHQSEILQRVISSGSLKPTRRLSKQISLLKMAISSPTHNDDHASTDVLRKIPQHAECAQVFVGALNQLQKVRFAMVRLANAVTLPELLDAPIPIRFIFVILGPPLPDVDYHELGRSIATLMTNEVREFNQIIASNFQLWHFKEIAYSALSTESLLLAIDDFVDESIVVPPGEIDHRSLISVDDIKKALRRRKKRKEEFQKLHDEEPELSDAHDTNNRKLLSEVVVKNGHYSTNIVSPMEALIKRRDPLHRTGRLFGGLIEDAKCRFSVYKSDFTDAFHFQIVTSLVFMFFAAFSPAIGFGGLLGEKTGGLLGTSETLMAQCVCGVLWGFASCQPMLVMAATGPVLVFEASLFKFCDENNVDFLVFRVWVAFWVLIICIICVMFEGSFMVRYVTRFTEDIFATLIPLVFVYESLKFLVKNFIYHPLQPIDDYCVLNNISSIALSLPAEDYQSSNIGSISDANLKSVEQTLQKVLPQFIANVSDLAKILPLVLDELLSNNNSSILPETNLRNESFVGFLKKENNLNSSNGSYVSFPLSDSYHKVEHLKNQPDTALLSSILLLATCLIAFKLRKLRNSYFFGRTLRRAIGDFGVPIAILTVVLMYILFFRGPYLEHLQVPDEFSTTIPGRGWFVYPFGADKDIPTWAVFAAIVPAFFVFILFFVELEITQSLLSMKERGLRKSMGFHFDLALLGICTLVCSLTGLPWMCSATVQSLTHSSSLTVMKRHAPGERAQVDFVLEQRVTTICIALLTGACAFLGFLLKNIPVAVLFGIFLYLGIMNMLGVQFLHRLILMIVPQKYYPDYPYCQQVSMWRMHLYTFVQLLCLIILWVCKSVQITSMAFPFVLMLIALFRKFLVPKVFRPRELEALDGHAESDKEHEEDEDFYSDAGWPM